MTGGALPVVFISGRAGMMGSYSLLDHTADIGLQAQGEDWGDLLHQVALALLQVVGVQADAEPQEELTVVVNGADREELLVNWLNELLFCIEVRERVPRRIMLQEVTPERVAAVLKVIPINAVASFAHEVKSATYHRILVKEQPAGSWHARVYLDL